LGINDLAWKFFVRQKEQHVTGGEIEMDESYFGGRRNGNRGRRAAGKIPVFGILERGGEVRVEVVQNVTGETLLMMAIKKVKRGNLIYTDNIPATVEQFDKIPGCINGVCA
jgi:transposase